MLRSRSRLVPPQTGPEPHQETAAVGGEEPFVLRLQRLAVVDTTVGLDLADLARRDHVDEDVPFRLLESDDVALLPDADGIALHDDFRAGRAGWAERDLVHGSFPPSMCWQTTPRRALEASQVLRIFFTSRRRPSSSASFCFSSARTWTHGPGFAHRSATIWPISFNVRPSRRACVTKCSTPSTSGGYTRYPAAVRRGFGTMPRAS